MKKKLSVILALLMVVAILAGCGSSSAPAATTAAANQGDAAQAEWKWERKVTLVCPWGVGGGANGIDFTCKQPADGYTYVLGTQSHIMLDLQKILPVDFRAELQPVAKLVHFINIVAGSKKAMEGKYTNFTEFINYAKEHPQEMTCGMLTATGADSVAMKQTLAGGLGCDVTEVEKYIKVVNYSGGAELSSAIVGGHVNIMITGADEIMGLIESGDIVPLVSISENRMSTLPDLECTGELGIDSYVGTWRGIFCRKGTPEAAINATAAALKTAWESDDYQAFLKQACYLDRPGYADAATFQQLMSFCCFSC